MFSVKAKNAFSRQSVQRSLVIATAAMLGLATAGSAIAQSMVVRSTGPSAAQYPRGKKLAANTQVSLKTSDRVTVLDKSGTRVLSGPGTFTVDGKVSRDQNAATQISSLLTTDGRARRSRTGAVRGAPTVETDKRSPNLWYVDITRSGKFCVANPEMLLLWRPEVAADKVVELGVNGGASATVAWRGTGSLARWPLDTVPVSTGALYNMVHSDDTVTRLELVQVAVDPDDAEQVAEILIANGCNNQLDLMVDKLVSSAAIQESVGGE